MTLALPMVTVPIGRPSLRAECARCTTCQAWREGLTNGMAVAEYDGVLPCGHDLDEAVRRSRPCIFVGCRSNLFLDIRGRSGDIQLNFYEEEPETVHPEHSCVLDIAEQGDCTLDEVGEILGVSRERIRQLESLGLTTLRRMKSAADLDDEPGALTPARAHHAGKGPEAPEPLTDDESDADGGPATRVSFFAEPESDRLDLIVCANVWGMFARASNSRGIDCRSRGAIALSKRHAERRAAEAEQSSGSKGR